MSNIFNAVRSWFVAQPEQTKDYCPMSFCPQQVVPTETETEVEPLPSPFPIKDMPKKSWGVVTESASPGDVPVGTYVLRTSGNYYFAGSSPKWASNRKVKQYLVRGLTRSEQERIDAATKS